MRSDMKKVVVERPRWGSRVRNQKFGARLRYIEGHDYEEQPKKARGFESYHDGCGKYFTDVLGPLVRFLRSKDPVPELQDIFLKRRAQLNWGVNWIATEKQQCNRYELKEVQRLLESGKGREPKTLP